MREDLPCPVCDESQWKHLGERTFSRDSELPTEYLRLRFRVLFELWVTGQRHFSARFALCERCGFVVFTPRPSAEELDAKYRFLSEHEVPSAPRLHPSPLDLRRSRELFAALSKHFDRNRLDLLDFGGGPGSLLGSFLEAGMRCSVVDYTKKVMHGIEWLGNTLGDVEPGRAFDIVLCSHVFEHLADPVGVARQLHGLLKPMGLLFAEVPLEIVGGMPGMREPVTHVNFFCETSLCTAVRRAGFEVLASCTEPCLFASGRYRPAVRVVARHMEHPVGAEALLLPGPRLAEAALAAGPLQNALWALKHPKLLNLAPRFKTTR